MAKKTKQASKPIVTPKVTTPPPPKCPKGEYWNGTACVPDIGE